jgi:hypothetical protein
VGGATAPVLTTFKPFNSALSVTSVGWHKN